MITVAVILKRTGPEGTSLFDYGYQDNGRAFERRNHPFLMQIIHFAVHMPRIRCGVKYPTMAHPTIKQPTKPIQKSPLWMVAAATMLRSNSLCQKSRLIRNENKTKKISTPSSDPFRISIVYPFLLQELGRRLLLSPFSSRVVRTISKWIRQIIAFASLKLTYGQTTPRPTVPDAGTYCSTISHICWYVRRIERDPIKPGSRPVQVVTLPEYNTDKWCSYV